MTFRKIVVAHDFSDPANRALIYAARLAKQLGSELHLVHVLPDLYDGRSDPTAALPWTGPGQMERYMHFLTEELQHVAREQVPDVADAIKCHVFHGDPVKHVEELAQRVGADLLVVASTGKGAVQRVLLGSVAQALLRTSPIPVLSVH